MTMARALQALSLGLLAWSLFALKRFWDAGSVTWLLLALLPLLHVPAMALEFVWMRQVNRADPAPRPRMRELFVAWVAEAYGALWIFGWQLPWRWDRFPDLVPADAASRRGVVLVHGFICNRGLWNAWWPQLRAAGVPCTALSLESVFGPIERHAPRLDDAVRRLTAVTGQPPLLVAHSMGGLAVRAWLREFDGDARVHGVITVGTPHHGTWLARFGFAPNTRQMRPHSEWLQQLAAHEPPDRYRRFTCFYGNCDNVVFPCMSATLPGADNRLLRGHAHVHLLRHPNVLTEVLRRLQA